MNKSNKRNAEKEQLSPGREADIRSGLYGRRLSKGVSLMCLNNRIEELKKELRENVKKLGENITECNNLVLKGKTLKEKSDDYRIRISNIEVEIKTLKRSILDNIENTTQTEKVVESIGKKEISLKGLKTALQHIEDVLIPEINLELDSAKRNLNREYRNIFREVRNQYSSEVDLKLQENVELPIVAWDQAIKEINSEIGFISAHRIPVKLAFNKVVNFHFGPPR